MKRKVVKTGEGTYVISLPKSWVKSNNIQKGQSLVVEEEFDLLRVYSTEKAQKKTTLKLTNESFWYLNRVLRKLYASGYDQIELHFKNPSQMEDIRKCVEYLEGFEIVKTDNNMCLIKGLLSSEELSYTEIIDNMLWLINSQFNVFHECFIKKSNDNYSEIDGVQNSITKLAHLGRRLLNIQEKQDIALLKDSYLLFTNLIYISSYISYSAKEIIKNKLVLSKEEMSLVDDTMKMYQELLWAKKSGKLVEIQKFFQRRTDSFESDIKLLSGKNPAVVHFMLGIRKEMNGIGNYLLLENLESKINEEESE